MRHQNTARALSATLTALGAFAALPAVAQDAVPAVPETPPAAANGPGPATQPPPAPGTTLPSPTQPAPSTPATTAATPPPNYGFQYNGLLDAYYLYDFNNPQFKGNPNNLGTPVYDVRDNAPTLSLAEINLFQNPRPHGFGYKATLITGDTAQINHGGLGSGPGEGGSGTGEGRFENVQQLYGTYNLTPGGAGVDVGKFYTIFGYEVTESNADYNYSRSLAYGIVPIYHAGVRIYNPTNLLGVNGLGGTFIVAQALYDTGTEGVQSGASPAFMGQLNYTAPSGKFDVIEDYGVGHDRVNASLADTSVNGGDGSNVTSKDYLSDTNFTYNFNSNMLFGLDYVNLGIVASGPDGGPTSGRYNGGAAYFRQQLNVKDAYALRVSGLDEQFGGSPDYRPFELTGTYEVKPAANFLTRFELRYDDVNSKGGLAFADGTGTGTSNQITASVSGVFTF